MYNTIDLMHNMLRLRSQLLLQLVAIIGVVLFLLAVHRASESDTDARWHQRPAGRANSACSALTTGRVPVYLLTFPNSSTERQSGAQGRLQRNGFNVTLVYGFDGVHDPLPPSEVHKFAGPITRLHLARTKRLSPSERKHLLQDQTGPVYSRLLAYSLKLRIKFASKLGFLKTLRLIQLNSERFAIFVEDDVAPHSASHKLLHKLLCDTPTGWDLLVLYWSRLHARVSKEKTSQRSRRFYSGPLSLAYLLTQQAAYTILTEQAVRSDRAKDMLVSDAVSSGKLSAFAADPPIFHRLKLRSTIEPNMLR